MTKKRTEIKDDSRHQPNETRAEWEELFFREITQYLSNPDKPFFSRLHFLCTDKQKIYVLDRKGWWHTLSGNVGRVRKRLQAESDYLVEVVHVRNSSRGWIAYFARSSGEEPGVGWNDRGLVIVSKNKNLQRRARKAQKSYLNWMQEKNSRRR